MRLADLARQLGGRIVGEDDRQIVGVASLELAQPNELSFVQDRRYVGLASETQAGALLIAADLAVPDCPAALIVVDDVAASLDAVLLLFAPPDDLPLPGVHPTAVVDASASLAAGTRVAEHAVVRAGAQIGERTVIGPGCFVGRGVTIGEDTMLGAHVVVHADCQIGSRVRIEANSTIGAEGFGYRFVDGRHKKIPHIGSVVIEDDVEIGANSCVDRAKMGRTVIGQGTKIDNLVQIAHNCRIGRHCIVVGMSGVAGSAVFEDYVIVSGLSGIGDHVRLESGAMVAAGSVVLKDVPAGQKVGGSPARELTGDLRDKAAVRRLAKLERRVREVEQR